ncbi:MAG: matrixin family metalloprotease [Candidatus Buchananbacteria bacterium]
MKFFRRQLVNLGLLIILLAVSFYFRQPIIKQWQNFYQVLQKTWQTPCTKPIAYSLGSVDAKFKISKQDLLKILAQAGKIWSAPAGKQLFTYQTEGALKINLIYDYRQEATDKLALMGILVKRDLKSYEALTSKYNLLKQQYATSQAAVNKLQVAYNQQFNDYQATVAKWNKQGGAPEAVYRQLNLVRQDLDQLAQQLTEQVAKLNELIVQLNAEGVVLNGLAEELNLKVERYNKVGVQNGQEFNEGIYTQSAEGQVIDVYQFDNPQVLLRVLAHEFGHALGLDHTANSKDIMYRLNQSSNLTLSANDLTALKNKCKLK